MKSTYAIAALIAIVLSVWLASGQLESDTDKVDSPLQPAVRTVAAPTRVRTQTRTAEPIAINVTMRGRTEAKRSVSVRAETTGQVVELPVEKGARVEEGDLLCKLSIQDRDIKLEEAQATVTHARLEYEGSQKLAKEGFQSETNIAEARVGLIRAQANLRSRQLDLAYRNIRSPFKGIVEERTVNIGDFLQRGGICAEVLDPNPMLVVGHVTEKDVGRIRLGADATATLASGEVVSGIIRFISHSANSATRTYRVEVEIPNLDFSLRDGLSAEIYLPLDSVLAHRVSPALLSLGDDGEIGIRILDDDDIVHFVNVAILSDTQEGVWLTGLPDSIRLITLGQELVFEGQKVIAVGEAQ